MTGSFLSRQMILPLAGLSVAFAAIGGYQFYSGSLSAMPFAFLVAFAAPALLALHFKAKTGMMEKERNNMRMMLEARAAEFSAGSATGSTPAMDEVSIIAGICQRLARGDFEARIIGIEEDSPFTNLKWAINELADRTDAFMREAAASMEHVADQKYY
ncbi:MAG: hypothetical protein ABJN51_01440, partial [Sneathiella sp.]